MAESWHVSSVTRLLSLSLSLFHTSTMSGLISFWWVYPSWSQLAIITPGQIVLPGSRFRGKRKSLYLDSWGKP